MQYTGLVTPSEFTDTEALATQPWSAPGYFRNLIAQCWPAPGSGVTLTFTVLKDSASTPLALVLSGTGASATQRNTASLLQVVAGSKLALQLSRSGGSGDLSLRFQLAVEFVSTGGESGYGFTAGHAPALDAVSYAPVFGYTDANTSIWTPTLAQAVNLVSAAGRLLRYDVLLTTAPGGGGSWNFCLVKNGVAQTGEAGTVNTQLNIAEGVNAASRSFALSLRVSDAVALRLTPSGTPAATTVGFSCRFAASTLGESMVCTTAQGAGAFIPDATRYAPPQANMPWSEDETVTEVIGGVTPFTIRRARAQLLAARDRDTTLAFRRDAASPTSPIRITIPQFRTVGSDLTHTMRVADGDTWDVELES